MKNVLTKQRKRIHPHTPSLSHTHTHIHWLAVIQRFSICQVRICVVYLFGLSLRLLYSLLSVFNGIYYRNI